MGENEGSTIRLHHRAVGELAIPSVGFHHRTMGEFDSRMRGADPQPMSRRVAIPPKAAERNQSKNQPDTQN